MIFSEASSRRILAHTAKDQWKYCPTFDNPADIGTRGTNGRIPRYGGVDPSGSLGMLTTGQNKNKLDVLKK